MPVLALGKRHEVKSISTFVLLIVLKSLASQRKIYILQPPPNDPFQK